MEKLLIDNEIKIESEEGKKTIKFNRYEKSIDCKAKLKQLDNTIRELKKIGLNVDEYVETCNQFYKEIEILEKKGIITEADYERILQDVNTYYALKIESKEYYIHVFYECETYLNKIRTIYKNNAVFDNKLNVDDVDKINNINFDVTKLLLKKEKYNFDDNIDIIDKLFSSVYEILKISLFLGCGNILYQEILEDPQYSLYISNFVQNDLEYLEENNKITPKLRSIILENKSKLSKQFVYVERELIKTIAPLVIADLNVYKNVLDKRNEIEIQQLIDEKKEYDNTINKIYKQGKNLKYCVIKNVLSAGCIAINLTLLAAGVYFSGKLSKNLLTKEKYKIVTETYDTSLGESIFEEDYSKTKTGSVEVYNYSPWEYRSWFKRYDRKVTGYTVIDPDLDMEIKEYLGIDFSELKKKLTKTEKATVELPSISEYIANGNKEKYVIIKKTVDLDDVQSTTSGFWIFIPIVVGVLILVAEYKALDEGIIDINFISLTDEKKELEMAKNKYFTNALGYNEKVNKILSNMYSEGKLEEYKRIEKLLIPINEENEEKKSSKVLSLLPNNDK